MEKKDSEKPNNRPFNPSCIILGFTGSLGSGCSFIAEGVSSALEENGHYYKVSDYLREEAQRNKIEPTVKNLQMLGDKLRGEKKRLSILIEKCIERMESDDSKNHFSHEDDAVIIIDGIKNTGEVKCLRAFANFYLISVHAKRSIRKKRLVGQTACYPRLKDEKEFLEADKRDEEEDIPNGQQIKKCNYLADIIINNERVFPKAREIDRRGFFNKFVEDYIYPMRKVREGKRAHDRPPRTEETLMTMAYCVSKRSSCIQRKVGAVLAYSCKLGGSGSGIDEMPEGRNERVQVVSVGYNDVPAGIPCVFREYGKCYRDHLQEEHASKLKFCPSCGKQIPEEIICPLCSMPNKARKLQCENEDCNSEILASYECEGCECKVFSTFLPGEEDAPGKLLDMCRALHAEENAILGLPGIGRGDNGKLVLYTTTFPCNLCANKIVAAGIGTVYYAEPYTMKESWDVLKKANVKIVKFEGIKSSAYFRLYT